MSEIGVGVTEAIELDEGISERLRALISDLGDDKSVEITGKSLRQLKRYIAGDEPPFGVLRGLVEASGATLDWVTFGRARSRKDYELSIVAIGKKVGQMEKALKSAASVDDLMRLKEAIGLNRKVIALAHEWVRLDNMVVSGKSESAYSQQVASPERKNRQDQTTIAADVFEMIGELLQRVYRDEAVKLPATALVGEVSRYYKVLFSRMDDPSDLAEARSLGSWLENRIRGDLKEAAAAPGTGKREVS